MRVKFTLTKNFGVQTRTEYAWTMKEIKAMAQEIWKMSILYPKNLSSHEISKKYNKQWGVLQKKLFLKIS